jgi:hypothetical protein
MSSLGSRQDGVDASLRSTPNASAGLMSNAVVLPTRPWPGSVPRTHSLVPGPEAFCPGPHPSDVGPAARITTYFDSAALRHKAMHGSSFSVVVEVSTQADWHA